MKVLHVAPSIARSYGGPTESLVGYIVAAQTVGIEITVVAPDCDTGEAAEFRGRIVNSPIRLFSSVGRGAFEISPGLLQWVRRKARSYDAVHVHGLFNTISSLAAHSCIRQEIPVVIRPFGTLSRYTFLHRRTVLKRAYLAIVERGNIERASAIHFTTETERSNAEWHGVSFDGRAHIVPPPFSATPLRPRIVTRDVTRPHVVFVGRIQPVKNIEALLDAWPIVLRTLPSARLTIAGGGSRRYVRSLETRASRLGISNSVTFAGFIGGKAKTDLLDAASLFVLPSHHENFGIAVIEALNASLPVVISPHVQLAPLVEQTALGIVSVAEPYVLAAAIVRGVRDDELHERVRMTAGHVLRSTFSPVHVGQLLLQMYQASIDRTHLPAPQ